MESERQFIRVVSLRPGWHRLRIDLETPERIGLRKELRIEANGVTLAALAWNRRLRDDFLVRIEEPAEEVRLTFRHAPGELHLQRFSLRRVSAATTAVRAFQAKLKLLYQFNCLGSVMQRGGRHLMHGEFRTFGRKLLKGLPDSRTMKLEAKRAAEAGAAWWRRRSLHAEQIAALRRECDALENPEPVAVLLPVDATRVDHARLAAFSVLRQIYPHWQLRILWPNHDVPKKLASAIRHDDRAAIIAGDGLADALRRSLAEVPCERAVLFSPDAELAEHALLRMNANEAIRYGDFAVALPIASFTMHALENAESLTNAVAMLRWAQSLTAKSCEEPLAFALDSGGDAALALPAIPATASLHLAGNFTGISGWDAIGYQVLRGLLRSGVSPKRHWHSPWKSHTLPPGLSFEKSHREPGEPLLVIAPPYQMKSFAPDACSAAFTMWECDRLPASSVPRLNAARVVIVPSRWGFETFRAGGITVPIEIVPLGYDPFIFHPRATATDSCVFGTAGALGAGGMRKNLAMVIAAFRAAFATETDVRLRIKITPNCPALDCPDDPRIDVTRAVLPPGDVAAWNRSLTTYVNASLAEGFGLHLLEAMACGVPLISTRVSGPADYFDESVGIVLPHREVSVRNDFYDGHWYEPDFEAMVAALRRVYRNRDEARNFGEAASCRARRYTWRDTGRKLIAVLKKHNLLLAGRASDGGQSMTMPPSLARPANKTECLMP